MKSFVLQLYEVLAVMLGAFMGLSMAIAPSVVIWGPDILNTALGSHPDMHHPAFILGLVLLVPSEIVGIAAGFFILFLPVAMRFPAALDSARCLTTPSQIAAVRRYATRLLEYLERADVQLKESKAGKSGGA